MFEEGIDIERKEVDCRTIVYNGYKFKVKSDGTIYLVPETRDRHNPKYNFWTKGKKEKDGRMYFKGLPVDRIVLSAYQGDIIEFCEVEHIDNDLTNNRVENLRSKNNLKSNGTADLFFDTEVKTVNEEEIQSDPDLESQFAYLIKKYKEKEEALLEEERLESEREKARREFQERMQKRYAAIENDTPEHYRQAFYPDPSKEFPYKIEYYRYECFQHSKSSIYENDRILKRKEKDGQLLTYAFDENNELVYVDDVKNGNDCGCRCPHCNEFLCAENGGKIKAHYFSHRNGSDCLGACEAALHLLAKRVLKKCNVLRTPVFVDGKTEMLEFDRVELEVIDKVTGRKPDCVAYKEDHKPLWVEFRNTHAVDEEKIKVIRANAIECVEIDLGGCELQEDKLREFLMKSTENRVWIYSERNEKIINDTKNEYKKRVMFAYNASNEVVHVDDARGQDCHCILCGTPMKWTYGYFYHLDEKCQIQNENYCKSVISGLIAKCVREGCLNIRLLANVACKDLENCPMPMPDCQKKERFVSHDLVKLGFKDSGQGYIEGTRLMSDIQLTKEYETGKKVKIDIVFRSDADYSNVKGKLIEIDPNYQTIEDLLNNQTIDLTTTPTYFNFDAKAVDRGKIRCLIKRFHLYRNGNCYLEEDVNCSALPKDGKRQEILLMNIFGREDKQMCYRLATMYCLKRGLKVFLCNACRFMKETYSGDMICILYRTKGTPKYPLQEKKVKCVEFREDDGLNQEMARFEKMIEVQRYR